MAKKWYAVHKETGEQWKPDYPKNSAQHQYLVMYDSGKVAKVTESFYTYIEPLGSEWHVIWKPRVTS